MRPTHPIYESYLSGWIHDDWQKIPYHADLKKMLSQLPDRPGLYALSVRGRIYYIGMSAVSLKRRWKRHHKESNLRLLQTMDQRFELRFFTLANIDTYVDPDRIDTHKQFIKDTEQLLIRELRPLLNGVDEKAPRRKGAGGVDLPY